MMILDMHGEVFIWIGQCVESKEKQKAFEIGQVSTEAETLFSIDQFQFAAVVPLFNMQPLVTFSPEIHRACKFY